MWNVISLDALKKAPDAEFFYCDKNFGFCVHFLTSVRAESD